MCPRRGILLRLVVAVGVVVAVGAPTAGAGSTVAPSGEQTHPHVTPHVGGRHRTFTLSFTLAQAPGRTGMEFTDYRPVISAPAHARQSCSPTQPAPVTTGTPGEVKRIALRPPAHGWCKGRYGVTVYLQRTTICGPPIEPEANPRIVCLASAGGVEPAPPIGDINTGQTHFTIP